ncbi:MAG: hypothetical protein GF334_08780 [Candidatus Altiarchaeales archaeon]|nr:hypothetical protein [Candidatus Altiarchaeales archaeon]
MTPEQVQHITSLLFMENMQTVVEIGAGVSTPCIAWAMLHYGCGATTRLDVIETDKRWIDRVRSLLSRIHPVSDHFTVSELIEWHTGTDEAIVAQKEKDFWPDMIIIDGPDASDEPDIRLCNLDYVDEYVHPGMRVFVDDLNRRGEQRLFSHLISLNLGRCKVETRKENYGIIRYI